MNVKDIEKKRYEARARYLLNNNLFTKPKKHPLNTFIHHINIILSYFIILKIVRY